MNLIAILINEFPEIRDALNGAINDAWNRSFRMLQDTEEMLRNKHSDRVAWKQHEKDNKMQFDSVISLLWRKIRYQRYERQFTGIRFGIGER